MKLVVPVTITDAALESSVPMEGMAYVWDFTIDYGSEPALVTDGAFPDDPASDWYRNIATGSNLNQTPSTSPLYWEPIANPMWDDAATYAAGDETLHWVNPSPDYHVAYWWRSKAGSNLNNEPPDDPATASAWWEYVDTVYQRWVPGEATTDGWYRNYRGFLYEAIATNSGTTAPPDDEPNWLIYGPTNRFSAFDSKTQTQTTSAIDISYTLAVEGRIDTIGLLEVDGTSVNVTMRDPATTVTNKALYSGALDNAAWTKSEATIDDDAADDPFGGTTADIILPSVVNTTHSVSQDVAVTSGVTATASAWFADEGYDRFILRVSNAGETNAFQATVDLGAETATASAYGTGIALSATITADDVAGYRVTLTGSVPALATYRLKVYVLDATGAATFAGDGTSGLAMTGAQLEERASASQYIATTSASASEFLILHDEDYSLVADDVITDWYDYFFGSVQYERELIVTDLPTELDPQVEITITGTDTRGVGHITLGTAFEIGDSQYGGSIGIDDYSRVEVDEFGNRVVIERGYSRRGQYDVMIEKVRQSAVFRLLAQRRANPALFIPADDYTSTYIFGYPKNWAISISYPLHSMVNISIEGL